jgi:hypothetical protein
VLSSIVEGFRLNFIPAAAVILRRQFSMFGCVIYFNCSVFFIYFGGC